MKYVPTGTQLATTNCTVLQACRGGDSTPSQACGGQGAIPSVGGGGGGAGELEACSGPAGVREKYYGRQYYPQACRILLCSPAGMQG